MFELINCFYDEVVRRSQRVSIFPIKTDRFIYDIRFTPDWLIEKIKSNDIDDLWEDGGHCYELLMKEMQYTSDHIGKMHYVCDSDEIGEEYLSGDYSYFTGFIRTDVPFMFHQSSHWQMFPNRLILYGPEFQIEIITDNIHIEIYEVVPNVRDLFFIPEGPKRIEGITEFLINSDRSLLDCNFNRKNNGGI